MNKIENAIQTVHKIDHAPGKNKLNQVHPLVKIILNIFYLVMLTSINKYDFITTVAMSIYLIILGIIQDVKIVELIKRFKLIILFLLIVGFANPILDRTTVTYIGIIPITTGIISMTTLVLKSLFAVISTYFLITSTEIEEICCSLKLLHIPNILIITIMLTYRYIILFLKEVQRMWTAYQMRAPKQKGINYKVWGSMIGSLMIRSIDRAKTVYESMELRGFNPETSFCQNTRINIRDMLCMILGIALILIFRYIPVFEIIGNIFI